MGKTKIEWTHTLRGGQTLPGYTFNPWWGCTKVGVDCFNCYADRLSRRFGFDIWGSGKTRRMFGDKHWNDPIRWQRKGDKMGYRPRVFCGSMCDVFEDHPDVVETRERLWALIEATPRLIWMLLTKRPENMLAMVPERWSFEGVPGNVWLGVSAGDGATFWDRAPCFIDACDELMPSVAFLSLEPLVGPIDMGDKVREFDWVIVGGESGPRARPMHPRWVSDIWMLCQHSSVPFFMKQWGEWSPLWAGEKDEGSYVAVDNGEVVGYGELRHNVAYALMYKVGRTAAGKLLMGREWLEAPPS